MRENQACKCGHIWNPISPTSSSFQVLSWNVVQEQPFPDYFSSWRCLSTIYHTMYLFPFDNRRENSFFRFSHNEVWWIYGVSKMIGSNKRHGCSCGDSRILQIISGRPITYLDCDPIIRQRSASWFPLELGLCKFRYTGVSEHAWNLRVRVRIHFFLLTVCTIAEDRITGIFCPFNLHGNKVCKNWDVRTLYILQLYILQHGYFFFPYHMGNSILGSIRLWIEDTWVDLRETKAYKHWAMYASKGTLHFAMRVSLIFFLTTIGNVIWTTPDDAGSMFCRQVCKY